MQMLATAREAGGRAKIARAGSGQETSIRVRACVGMKGMRMRSVIRELRGREDGASFRLHEETVAFAQKALQPGQSRARTDVRSQKTKSLEIVVEDAQLSLAIGKKGRNVRFASS